MKKNIKTNQQKKIKLIVLIILSLLTIGLTGYVVYALTLLTGIETFIRTIARITLVLIAVILILSYLKSLKKRSNKYLLYIPFVGVYLVFLFIFGYYITKTYKALDKLTTNETVYSSSLVVMNKSSVKDIKDIDKKGIIGMVDDADNMVGYQIPSEIIETNNLTNEVIEYESYYKIIQALYDGEIDYAFLPTSYAVMFETMEEADFKTIREDTKIVHTMEKTEASDYVRGSSLTEPFTVLIMGVDSETESISTSSFNGDSLILITFNPKTLTTTMMSIPRDTYVPIACFANKKTNKITSAALYGEECMMNTIEDFTGIEIDYFVKINFKGVVKLVDTLGGLEIDVPYSFCEQDSNRLFGNNTIYVTKGLQTLNGEQALAFSRNRHPWPQYCSKEWSDYYSDDFIRGQNQQTVIRALLNKFQEIKSLNIIYGLLDTIGESMATNMSTSEILSLYNIGKDMLVKSDNADLENLLSIQRLYLSGFDKYIYDPGTGLNLYNYILYAGSVEDITEAMKINLGLIKPTLKKEFSFSIDEEYEEVVIGKGRYSTAYGKSESTLPDFTGDSETQAKTTAKMLGISVTFKYTETATGNNTVISQNYKTGTSISKVTDLVLTIATKKGSTDNSDEKPDDNEALVEVPNFVGMTASAAKTKAKALNLYLNFDRDDYTATDTVVSQDTKAGKTIKTGLTIGITMSKKASPSKPNDNQGNDEKDNEDKNIDIDDITGVSE